MGMKDFESKISQMVKACPKRFKIAFITTFIVGLCAHMFVYTNPLFVRDSVAIYQSTLDIRGFMGGRWLAMLLQTAMGGLSLPWLIGLITLSAMGISAYLVVKALDIERPIPVIIVSALMVTYPSITASHAYFSSVFVYAISLCLAAGAAVQIKRENLAGYGWGILLMVLSLGCYQAYVSFTASLLVLIALRKLMSEKDFSFKIWWTIIKMILVFVGAIFVYYFGCVFVNSLMGMPFGVAGYAGQEHIGDPTYLGVGTLLKMAYSLPFKYFCNLPYPTYLPLPILIVFWIGMVETIVQGTRLLIQPGKYRIWRYITAFGAGLFLPLTMNFVKLLDMGQLSYPHALMTFAFISPWLLMVMVNEVAGEQKTEAQKKEKKLQLGQLASWLMLLPAIIFTIFGCYIANVSYIKMNINYESGMAITNRVIARIESTPGYKPGETEVIILGGPKVNEFGYDTYGGFDVTKNITGVEESPFMSWSNLGTYAEQELQTKIKFGSVADYQYLEEVHAMGRYPAPESIKWIDDVLVVRF